MTLICKMRWFSLVALFGSVVLAGCGPAEAPSGTVSGTVNLDGTPLESGEITFISSNGGAASGAITNGQFKLDGSLPLGEYKVGVGAAPLTEAPGAEGDSAAPPASSVPAGYHTPSSSGITQNIQQGENKVTIELKASGPAAAGGAPADAAP